MKPTDLIDANVRHAFNNPKPLARNIHYAGESTSAIEDYGRSIEVSREEMGIPKDMDLSAPRGMETFIWVVKVWLPGAPLKGYYGGWAGGFRIGTSIREEAHRFDTLEDADIVANRIEASSKWVCRVVPYGFRMKR